MVASWVTYSDGDAVIPRYDGHPVDRVITLPELVACEFGCVRMSQISIRMCMLSVLLCSEIARLVDQSRKEGSKPAKWASADVGVVLFVSC